MRTNEYESAVLFTASLEDQQIETAIDGYRTMIEANGGTNVDIDKWGRRRLAYPIGKNKIGYYAIFRFSAPASFISKLERQYRIDESVIRFLTLQLDEKAVAFLNDQKAKAAAVPAAAEAETEAVAAAEPAAEEAPETATEE